MNSAYVAEADKAKHGHFKGAWVADEEAAEGELRTNHGGLFHCKVAHIMSVSNEPIPTIGSEWVREEVPTGTKDGANQTFTLAYAPVDVPQVYFGSSGGSARMKHNTDFTYSGLTLNLITFAPHTADGDIFFVDYLRTI